MRVLSFDTTTFSALPKSDISILESDFPSDSEMNEPPVRIAMSVRISFLISPNSGPFTAHT